MSRNYPACFCADYYPDADPVRPSDCPVRMEIDRLRALVEEAYREGFSDGEHSGDSYHHGYGAHRGDETWNNSDARAALNNNNNNASQEG